MFMGKKTAHVSSKLRFSAEVQECLDPLVLYWIHNGCILSIDESSGVFFVSQYHNKQQRCSILDLGDKLSRAWMHLLNKETGLG